MISYLLGLLPYVLGITLAILLPAYIIARQEIAIEGPFGWSALTFTERFPTNHWFSKLYRYFVGQDKWATEYHLTSNLIWLFMYFLSFLYIPVFSRLAGYSNLSALIGTFVLAIASFVTLNWVEDFIWFLIHPYYGPERHTPEYVPWFKNYKAGIPVGYWLSMAASIGITLVGAILLGNTEIFVFWMMVTVLLLVVIFGIIRPLSKNMYRIPLRKFWWKDIKYLVIQRCPYPMEAVRPFTSVSAMVIPDKVMKWLISEDEITPLNVVLRGKYDRNKRN
jgi:hypothetical protein